jgi:ATP-dependent 26S proteasome regulatory subunit
VPFEHPATFDKLAMDPVQKKEITDDLEAFMDGKQYYSDVGKAWKRGYLLYGPPGTGKSTLISAMANMLNYDVYDLDLTSVKNNAELRKLFIETKGRSIIVIEDIDAIEVDMAGNRKVADKKAGSSSSCCDPLDPNKDDGSRVTLSGLLSFVDGLWSASGGERIIVFTTNRVDMLDQALTRRGRMDMHIEMSYCRFGAFQVLANNYLKVRDHELFEEIKRLLDDTDMSPADVAHNLMPKSKKRKRDDDMPPADVAYYLKGDTDACLAGLVEALKKKTKREPTTTAPTIEVAAPAQNGTSK